jgi:hypothetical protein
MTELTALKRIFSPCWLMKYNIVKMHYEFWRTRSSLSVQNLRNQFEYLLTEVAAVGVSLEGAS